MENIASISTSEFKGKLETPIATLLWQPSSPNTLTTKSEEKFNIFG